ncbi:hypothetical protein [Microvirga puerhi]|uniref:Uncharacterized protein n=1 Tax=Microvirga puerhi TaxID=2876078 RepID=A0ABS7VI58_9HYPH|nr:hypothetical protein [Microvirga puerhi]MBZ6074707.1 hypothetical protein [Microvirga puerhi]
MRALLLLGATLCIAGCMSRSDPLTREPNYVAAQIYQNPAQGNDTFGGGALPPRIGGPM